VKKCNLYTVFHILERAGSLSGFFNKWEKLRKGSLSYHIIKMVYSTLAYIKFLLEIVMVS
jgi:hypothetical protein